MRTVSDAGLVVVNGAINTLVASDRALADTLLMELNGLVATDPNRQEKVNHELPKAKKNLLKATRKMARSILITP